MGVIGESVGLDHWELDCDREGDGASSEIQKCLDLGRQSSCLECPSNNSNRWLFQLHSQTVVEPGQGTLHGTYLPNLELQKKSPAGPEA